MAKPDKPLLSLGARGTIADTLTFQKRGREHFVRQKPIPTDPKSQAQLAQRQVYRDAVDTWHALTTPQKEAWRGVCPGLTAYQCFMKTQLKYVAPPIPIDIGAPAIDRATTRNSGYTYVAKDNPANASGIITTVKLWPTLALVLCRVGTVYPTNANTLKCRDVAFIGEVDEGSEQTFTGLSFAAEEGDYIATYFYGGRIEADNIGFAGLWRADGNNLHPSDEVHYNFYAGPAISLYGIGETHP
ncbi:hypothetical protein ES703_51570 [subsurface metagenome]